MTYEEELAYHEECTKYFAPLDEICEAMENDEGIYGLTNDELYTILENNKELMNDVENMLDTRAGLEL